MGRLQRGVSRLKRVHQRHFCTVALDPRIVEAASLMQLDRFLEVVDRGSYVRVDLEPAGVAHGNTTEFDDIFPRKAGLHHDFGCTSALR